MRVKIKVKPNSKKQEIVQITDCEYKVNLKEKAENNKTNIELLKLLRKHFGKEVRLIKGLKSKNKIVEVKCQ